MGCPPLVYPAYIAPPAGVPPPSTVPFGLLRRSAPTGRNTATVTNRRKIDELLKLVLHVDLWRDRGANARFCVYLVTLSNQRICIMSKIKWGAIVVDGRGKLGGHVFTKTRSGATMRTKVTPVNPQSPAQAAARSRLGSQSQGWRGLTEEQRIRWNDLAARTSKTNIFGDQYFPTGKNLFTGLNSNLLLLGQSANSNPPELAEMPVIIALSPVVNTEDAEIALGITTEGVTANSILVIEATAPQSVGRFNFDGNYRIIMVPGDAGAPDSVYASYTAKFGIPAVGSKIGFRAYYVNQDSGQQSPRFAAASIVLV